MVRFWLKLSLFALPFAAILGVPVAVLVATGELTSVDSALRSQARRTQVLYGLAYSNPVKRYKLRGIQQRRPEILALGSSRAMQFRSSFFRDGEHFYNAGGIVTTVWDNRHVLAHLPAAARPKLILVGLDQWFVNPRWGDRADTGNRDFESEDTAINTIQRNWRVVYRDLRSGKIVPGLVFSSHPDAIGLSALVHGKGFRSDGSYFYGDCIWQPDVCEHWDRGFADTLDRIARGERRFEWGDRIDADAVTEVCTFVDEAAAGGSEVVGFLPPFAPAVWKRMLGSGQYAYLDQAAGALRPCFARHNFAFEDLGDAAALGATDEEFIDGFHGSEKTYVRVMLRLTHAAPALAARVDRAALEVALARASRFEVPESPEAQVGRTRH